MIRYFCLKVYCLFTFSFFTLSIEHNIVSLCHSLSLVIIKEMWRCKNKAENLTDWTGDLNIFYVTSELKRIFIKSGDRFFGVFLCFTPNSLSYPFRELIHWYLSFPAMCPALLRSGKECAQLVCAWLLNGTSTWRPWALVLGHETWGQGWLRRLNRSTYSV